MEEIAALHNLNLEWGCITNLMDKISDIEERVEGGWPELIDMVVDAVSEEDENKSNPEELFFNLYQYLFRLYHRLKVNSKKRPFNTVKRCGSTNHEGETYYDDYIIYNYDYATFKWLKEIGCGKYMTNDWTKIPVDRLTDKQRRALDRRCQYE